MPETSEDWKSVPCREWTGSICRKGYGRRHFRDPNRPHRPTTSIGVHRAEWIEKNGPIPRWMHVCHRCDNRKCYEIRHLFLGTAADNNRDMMAKGRYRVPRGEECVTSKLTDEDAVRIRELWNSGSRSQRSLAAEHGVDKITVRRIVQRISWRHLP